jgi:hypothetical protein
MKINILFSILSWTFFNNFIISRIPLNPKINAVISANIHVLLALYTNNRMLSIGYYLSDSIDLLSSSNKFIVKCFYILHHVITCTILYNIDIFIPIVKYHVEQGFIYADISNLFLYGAYYLLHSEFKHSNFTTYFLLIECIAYTFCRGIMVSYHTYQCHLNKTSVDYNLIFNISYVLMGLMYYWIYLVWSQYFQRTKHTIKDL